ncbi:MAG: hypothetical protein PHU25_09340 [Deltaproteobacteria bacterium]|nr:hypothetical protein [Deltaproteobacteria bacterium]
MSPCAFQCLIPESCTSFGGTGTSGACANPARACCDVDTGWFGTFCNGPADCDDNCNGSGCSMVCAGIGDCNLDCQGGGCQITDCPATETCDDVIVCNTPC